MKPIVSRRLQTKRKGYKLMRVLHETKTVYMSKTVLMKILGTTSLSILWEKISLCKKWSSQSSTSSVNFTKSSENCVDLVRFSEEILNGKLHFYWVSIILSCHWRVTSQKPFLQVFLMTLNANMTHFWFFETKLKSLK